MSASMHMRSDREESEEAESGREEEEREERGNNGDGENRTQWRGWRGMCASVDKMEVSMSASSNWTSRIFSNLTRICERKFSITSPLTAGRMLGSAERRV
jgi:hypothetical protein